MRIHLVLSLATPRGFTQSQLHFFKAELECHARSLNTMKTLRRCAL